MPLKAEALVEVTSLRMTAAGIAWIKQPTVVRDTSFIELRVAPVFRH
ncbi:hypothetical protein [Mesorhizobium sp.]|nr:hypothetical protein [Mesorhizobium sp.]